MRAHGKAAIVRRGPTATIRGGMRCAVPPYACYIDNVVDDLITQTSAAPKDGENFVEHAVENFEKRYAFPYEKDEMGGIHYFVARALLLERIK